MKTTLVLRDDLVRRAKARAALRGQPLSRYMEESLERSLALDEGDGISLEERLKTLPPLSKAATDEIKAVVDEASFRTIDEDMWA